VDAGAARAERAAAEARRWIAELVPVVGDPETVPDEHGRLPRDRRDRFLTEFTAAVDAEAAGLTGTLPALRASLRATPGKLERAEIREQISRATARLAYLQALPPFTAGSMCSECPTPAAWHATGVTFCLQSGAVLRGPCPSWPVWNTKITAGLTRFAEAMRPHPTVKAPQPVPQPLAVIADGSPVEDLIARLTQIQAVHPGAQVRRGRKGSWEIWPVPPAQTTSERYARSRRLPSPGS